MENEIIEKEREFDLSILWKVMRKYLILLIIIAVSFAFVGAVYTSIFVEDQYTGSAKFWVNGSTASNVSSAATMGAAQMATNYAELAKSTELLKEAVVNYKLDEIWGVTEQQAIGILGRSVSAGKSDVDSFMFTVRVTTNDPEVAFDAISAMQNTIVNYVATVNAAPITGNDSEYITLIGRVNSVDFFGNICSNYISCMSVFCNSRYHRIFRKYS